MPYVGINIFNHNKHNMFWGLLQHWGWIWERIPTASFSKIFQCSRALAKRSYRGLLRILTSWHHVANILNSESRVFIFSVDTNHTKAQPIHGQYGSSRQRCSRDPRPLKDTQIKMPNQTYKLLSDSDEDIQVQKNAYVSVFSLCNRFKTVRWQQRFPPEKPQQ